MTLRRIAALAALTLLVSCEDPLPRPNGGGNNLPPVRPTLAQTYRPSGHMLAGDVTVHLFEWPWNDIATECTTVLGPAGVHAVQISPPNEHSITPSRDWSERYQPVSYSLARSRSGTAAEFEAMVNACAAAGVGIIVDAVINHMTNFPSPGTGSAGTSYTKYEYPGLYTVDDFHAPCALNNYQNTANVQDCELFSLPDLNTARPTVRQKIADYLLTLARLGVAGFRIDAAKHIQQVDLDSIFHLVNTTLTGEGRPLPYLFLEVVGNGQGEALGPRDYFGVGYASGGAADITEFTYTGVGHKFLGVGGQYIAQLNPNGTAGNTFSETAWGMMPAAKAVVFLQNHDTQHRTGESCNPSYRSGAVFRLANVWMLAQPYGYPSVLSGYAFPCNDGGGTSMGPLSDGAGWTLPVSCVSDWQTATPGQWLCEHRDPHIRSMIGFRRVVAGTTITNWWDNGSQAIAFSRGSQGFVAINNETAAVNDTITTGLAPGTYCDRITGGIAAGGGACAGTTITVGAGGEVQLSLAARTAVAIDVTTKL